MTAPPVAGLKDRELRSLEERRLWRLEALALNLKRMRSSNQAIGLMVLKVPWDRSLSGAVGGDVHGALFYGRIRHMRIIVNLILIFVSLFLIACSHDSATKKKPVDESQEYAEAAIKARKTGPLEGDVRVMNGLEYVWGRNVKYMNNPVEPL